MNGSQMNGISETSYKCKECGHEVPSGNRAIHSLRCSRSLNRHFRTGETEGECAAASSRVSHPVSASGLSPPAEGVGLNDFGISHYDGHQEVRSAGPSDFNEEVKVAEVRVQ